MLVSLRSLFVSLALLGSIFACTDHQLRPVSPLKVRLKTTDNVNFGGFPFKTEYNYDASNRVTSFTTSIGSKGVFQYDEQNRYKLFDYYLKVSDPTAAEETYFTYNPNDNNFVARTYGLNNGSLTSLREERNFLVDANKQVLQFTGFQNGVYMGEVYSYTGNNVTSVNYVGGRVITKFNYEYDDKLNPYYGLIAPDISAMRRFSRNNVTKIIRDIDNTVIAEYTYEYNAQGLPLKMNEKNGSGQVVYTYESY